LSQTVIPLSDDHWDKGFGQALRARRKKLGLTLHALASRLGMHHTAIVKNESRGMRTMSALKNHAEALGLEVFIVIREPAE